MIMIACVVVIRFENYYCLLLLLLLPVIVVVRRRYVPVATFLCPGIYLIKKIIGNDKRCRREWPFYCRCLSIILLIFSIAVPVWNDVIFLDKYFLSGSMIFFLIDIFLQATIFHRMP